MTDNTEYIQGLLSRFENEDAPEDGEYRSWLLRFATFFWGKGRVDGMLEQRFLSNPELVAAVDHSLAHPEESVTRKRRDRG